MAYEGLLTGEIFEDFAELSVDELSRLCTVDRTYIIELVEEGVLHGSGSDATDWRFPGAALRRARTALRLQRELEINLSGVALVLELMEELGQLRAELARRR
jgi:chaperone modulatory protein CbpM